MPRIIPRLRLLRPTRGTSRFAPKKAVVDRLSDLTAFGSNPGNLRARCYVPEGLPKDAPLVVVLHGCTQDAAVYDHGSGWSALADREGFALLYPEQQRANNPMLCFNWFQAGDIARGRGEAASIAAMIVAIQARHGLDPRRTFVTGLSAGGAMTTVMLAAYPELFAAGAPIAGVAYGCADSVGDAFECMAGRGGQGDAEALARNVRRASSHKGPWPRLQVWQGSADTTVVPGNADSIVRQWAALHGLADKADRYDEVEGFPRRAWLGADGEAVLEHLSITGMAHGVPVAAGGEEAIGAAGAHMLEVGLSSTLQIARFFGIAEAGERRRSPAPRVLRPEPRPAPAAKPASAPAAHGPQAVIERALRAAGLMR
ncbi:MAG TPA: PHB depolymerase family esterase [Allosphingosinicella sp.]|jgi:poly(hydroxyalkanoate) depolymerase family esterase